MEFVNKIVLSENHIEKKTVINILDTEFNLS